MAINNVAGSSVPIFPKAEILFIHTGNIVNWNRLKKKPSQSPTAELTESISTTLIDWKNTIEIDEVQFATSIECINAKHAGKISPQERETLKITVKIFLSSYDEKLVYDALDTVMAELGIDHVESVLLSFPPEASSDSRPQEMRPSWRALEAYVEEEKVFVVGASDLTMEELSELVEWSAHKPTTNQINLSNCCTIPADMQEFARANDVQLLTHTDPTDLFPVESFQQILEDCFTSRDAELWTPCWTVRYSSMVKGRGVIRSKGYMTKWSRDLKRRK